MTGNRKRYSAEFKEKVALEAMTRHGRPEIFNTDQVNQFTSPRFTGFLTAVGIWVSMGGRGRNRPVVEYYNADRPRSADEPRPRPTRAPRLA